MQPVERSRIDLRELALIVLRGWKIVACTIGVFLILAIIDLHSAPSILAIKMVVTPVQGSSDQSSTRANSLSSLAQLAGLSLGPSGGQSMSQFRTYIDSLRSRDLADEIAKNPEIMRYIFWRDWDAQAQTWREPRPTLSEWVNRTFMGLLGVRRTPWQAPNGARLQEYFAGPGGIGILQDIKRPDLATIEYDSSDPEFAIKLLNTVNKAADNHLRRKALLRATQYIDYLSRELNTVTVAEHRQAIMQALSEQEKFKMSASSAAPYAAEVFDSPSASITPVWPRPFQAYELAIIKGLFVGAAIVLALWFFGERIRDSILLWFPVERLPLSLRRPLRL